MADDHKTESPQPKVPHFGPFYGLSSRRGEGTNDATPATCDEWIPSGTSSMTHWPLWLRYVNKRLVQVQEMFFRNQRVFGAPFFVTLESGNACNLRCPLCATTFREKEVPKGMVTLDAATQIIDRFPAMLVLSLSLWGEPFLNKDIFEIIKYARRKKISVLVQSHFSLPHFNREMAQRILDSDLDTLWLSIDGASQHTYEVYRRGGDFNLVMRNLELLCRLKNEQKRMNPKITWKVVVNKFNEHEVPTAKRAADRLGVEFLTVEIYTPRHLESEWKPHGVIEQSGYRSHTDQSARCYSLWQVMTVNFNGDVFPCCSEWSPQDALGNVLRTPVNQIWNTKDYRRRRANNKSGRPACDDCHLDKNTNHWRNWHPTTKNDYNATMLPLTLVRDPAAANDTEGPVGKNA
jgi:radical SAM protein with 4Fe4S-binding SPASM domain